MQTPNTSSFASQWNIGFTLNNFDCLPVPCTDTFVTSGNDIAELSALQDVMLHTAVGDPGFKGLVINYWEGGLQNGKSVRPIHFAPPTTPPPQDRVNLLHLPSKGWKHFAPPPPLSMTKTSSSCVRKSPKTLRPPPFQHG